MKETAHEYAKWLTALAPQAITVATVNGPSLSVVGFDEAAFLVDVGALGGTSPSLSLLIQESATGAFGGEQVAVAGATFGAYTNVNTPTQVVVGRLNLLLRQAFLRIVATGTGTAPTGSFAVQAFLGMTKNLPAVQVNAVAFSI
jgi:hypothetical protein